MNEFLAFDWMASTLIALKDEKEVSIVRELFEKLEREYQSIENSERRYNLGAPEILMRMSDAILYKKIKKGWNVFFDTSKANTQHHLVQVIGFLQMGSNHRL